LASLYKTRQLLLEYERLLIAMLVYIHAGDFPLHVKEKNDFPL